MKMLFLSRRHCERSEATKLAGGQFEQRSWPEGLNTRTYSVSQKCDRSGDLLDSIVRSVNGASMHHSCRVAKNAPRNDIFLRRHPRMLLSGIYVQRGAAL
jgi:hypothetical protein